MPKNCIKDYIASAAASVAHQSPNQTKLAKMKSMIIVALALVAVAAAVPVEVAPVQILKSNFDQQPDGTYNFGFDSENGISRQEEGTVKQVLDEENKPHDVVVVRGSYSYVNADGTPENIVYYADETGYHAEGSSVPKPPARR